MQVVDDTGDIVLELPSGYSRAVALHSAHLNIGRSLHIVQNDKEAHTVLDAPRGKIVVSAA